MVDDKTPANQEINQEPPVKKEAKPLTKGQSFLGYFLTICISVFSSVILTALIIPLIMGVSPVDFYRGGVLGNGSKTIIKTGKANNAISAVAQKVTPSVVTISTFKRRSDFESFLFPNLDQSSSKEPDATGSGVIYKSNGYIITNNHVVEGADKVIVTIGNEKNYPAQVIAGDSEADIAVLKVNKTALPAAEFGSTKDLEVGDQVIAIGSPFSFQHTVTAGIISAKNRVFEITDYQSQTQNTLTGLIQTDAAINPGNSGGALVDDRGRVVGINTAIASDTRSSAGIGFAIPVERVKSVAEQLINKGKVSHPYMGIQIVDSQKVADKDLPTGVFVQGVFEGGPADKSGVQAGDVITKIDGKNVKEANEVIAAINRKKVGDKISVVYVRNNQTIKTQVELAEKPSLSP